MENKYQEAFDYFFMPRLVVVPRNQGKRDEFGRNKDLLQELVDKETPMKVIFESNGSPIKSARCPKCNGLIHFGFETYCCYCGTKLSWE